MSLISSIMVNSTSDKYAPTPRVTHFVGNALLAAALAPAAVGLGYCGKSNQATQENSNAATAYVCKTGLTRASEKYGYEVKPNTQDWGRYVADNYPDTCLEDGLAKRDELQRTFSEMPNTIALEKQSTDYRNKSLEFLALSALVAGVGLVARKESEIDN